MAADNDVIADLTGVAMFIHRRGYWMTPPSHMPRLAHMDALCSLCKISLSRGNGFAFSYSLAQYQPRGIA